jgi:hypothetical protein
MYIVCGVICLSVTGMRQLFVDGSIVVCVRARVRTNGRWNEALVNPGGPGRTTRFVQDLSYVLSGGKTKAKR